MPFNPKQREIVRRALRYLMEEVVRDPQQHIAKPHEIEEILMQEEILPLNPSIKITHLLESGGTNIDVGDTMQDILDKGGSLIDNCMEPPVVLFQLATWPRTWWAGTVEFVVDVANNDVVRERLQEAIQECIDDESPTDLATWQRLLDDLPPPLKKEGTDAPDTAAT
jgi:hypothetical protein